MAVAVVATIMAVIHVGIRDLKNRAPQLVRRAARGDRIVITRYGKPRALLGPIVEAQEPGHRARMQAWRRERRAFERLTRMERRRLAGRFVAVHGGRIVDAGKQVTVPVGVLGLPFPGRGRPPVGAILGTVEHCA